MWTQREIWTPKWLGFSPIIVTDDDVKGMYQAIVRFNEELRAEFQRQAAARADLESLLRAANGFKSAKGATRHDKDYYGGVAWALRTMRKHLPIDLSQEEPEPVSSFQMWCAHDNLITAMTRGCSCRAKG